MQTSVSRLWEEIARCDMPEWDKRLPTLRKVDQRPQYPGRFVSDVLRPVQLLSLISEKDGQSWHELGAIHLRYHT